MITKMPDEETLEAWKAIWLRHKDKLLPNRKTGTELLDYLQSKYDLTEIHDKAAADAVIDNVTMNICHAEKLPAAAVPLPRTFFLENTGGGEVFYRDENKDSADIWGGEISRIFVGIDMVTGFFTVEGSTRLWDELFVFRGLDEKDIQNYVSVANYILCRDQSDDTPL